MEMDVDVIKATFEDGLGKWSIGRHGSVVSDIPLCKRHGSDSGHSDVEYYCGYLICESIPSIALAELISCLPELIAGYLSQQKGK
jgi:hypothetical protein